MAIVLDIAGLCLLAVLVYHFALMIRAPELANQQSARPSFWGMAYTVTVMAAVAAFSYLGASGLVYWLPFEMKEAVAGCVALLSWGLLSHLEKSSRATEDYRRQVDSLKTLLAKRDRQIVDYEREQQRRDREELKRAGEGVEKSVVPPAIPPALANPKILY